MTRAEFFSAAVAGRLMAGFAAIVASVQISAQAKYPEWPYAASYDAAKAAPQNNKVLFEDNKLRFTEVTILPGGQEPMSGQPYPSIVFHDAPLPAATDIADTKLDASSPLNGQGAGHGGAPPGFQYPTCDTLAPVAPHAVTNHGTFPIHFYRLEFKRLDGADLAANWKTWYPWMVGPIPEFKNVDPAKAGPPLSKEWPYPIAMDSVAAAPNNHKALYADDHVRLVEVTERGGSQENLHGHPYLSVFVHDLAEAAPAAPRPARPARPAVTPLGRPGPYHQGEDGDYVLDPKGAPMKYGTAGAPPAGMIAPGCSAATPQGPHAHINGTEVPGHFYRLEYLRIDGDGYRSQWHK